MISSQTSPTPEVEARRADLIEKCRTHPDDPLDVPPGLTHDDFVANDYQRRQSLDGFEDIYADLPHYIMRCTHRIWEEDGGSGTHLLDTHYLEDLPVHTTEGTVIGRQPVADFTDAYKAAYPGIELRGEDVVWSGNDVDGFHSSHRLLHIGTNDGDSQYGPASGRSMVKLALAHCVVKHNMIIEEWVTRDELRLIRMIGADEVALAIEHGTAEAERRGGPVVSDDDTRRPPAPAPDRGASGSDATHVVNSMFHDVWTQRDLDKASEYFTPNALIESSTDRVFMGPDGYAAFVSGWIDEFSDVSIAVEHQMSNVRVGGEIVATRWTLEGTHDGSTLYGPPTGRRVRLMGFSQQLVVDGRIDGEWTIYDEFGLMKQLYARLPGS